MNLPQRQARVDEQVYLDWEARQAEKHEYLDGEVFVMAAASDAHVTVAGNLFMALRTHLRGGPCRVLIFDMKWHVQADNTFFYHGCIRHLCRTRQGAEPGQERAHAGGRSAVARHQHR